MNAHDHTSNDRVAARRRREREAFFVWKGGFLIGVFDVDGDHREFFEIANWLHTASAEGRSLAFLDVVLMRLTNHATEHFAREEACLAASGCPALAEHREEHRRFLAALSVLCAERFPSPQRVFGLARDFILDHILGTDRQHGAWMVAATLSRAA